MRTKFDGQQIEVPAELRGAAPGDVLVVYLNDAGTDTGARSNRPSIWDVVGRAEHQRSTAEINAQVQAERDAWDDR
ncbi:MAG TPA: hypothetical protein VLJ39_06890 [Tepidisphaeraceae bacterium]|nr:hypothetical protein [Tepidisphaeraceae bacterium]